MSEPVLNKDADFYQLFAGNDRNFKPYYITHTKIQTLALIDEEHKGSNWYHWRTRLQPIRTAAEITANIIIPPLQQMPLYQKLAKKITELRLLGMPCKDIAKSLNISERTVIRASGFKK